MASKQLTATVRLNTNQAEQKLKKLAKAIDALNRAVGKRTNAYNDVNRALSASENITRKVKTETDRWGNSQKKVNSNLKSSRTILNDIGTKLRRIASTYLGVMGTKAMLGVSDKLTNAENKLNYTNAKALGKNGYNSDGSYSSETLNATANTMNKMYASAQKVRMGYTDMVSNVSKSMALASDAFGGNVDNAIRFQEVMAEAYAVGGASAEEMSSSMYQLIQALGSGQLAGDELRSVREGAPLAYKAIEEFAQGVWNTDESLKELASDGKVSADMVVAAMLNAEGAAKELDQAFAQTEQTFAQTWTQIKNAATQAFRPISDELRKALQNAIDNGLLRKIETAFATISKIVLITFEIIKNVVTTTVNWIADNWDWLKWVVCGVLVLIGMLLLKVTSIAIASAIATAAKWLWANKVFLIIAAAITALIYVFQLFRDGAITACEAITQGLLIVAAAILLIGILTLSLPTIIVGVIIGLLAIIFKFFEEVCYGAAWLFGWIVNILSFLWNIIVYVITFVVMFIVEYITIVLDVIIIIINAIVAVIRTAVGLVLAWIALVVNNIIAAINEILQAIQAVINPILSIIEFILNCCMGGFDSFGGAVANLIGQIISWFLALGKVVTVIIDAIFGTNWTAGLESLQDKVLSWGKNENSITLSRDGLRIDYRMDVSDAFSSTFEEGWLGLIHPFDPLEFVWDTADYAHTGYVDPDSWANSAGDWASGVKGSIDDWGSQFQTGESLLGGLSLDRVGELLGLNFDGMFNFPTDSDVGGSYNMPSNEDLMNGLDGIKDDTSKISDNVELSEEDLSFLRKVAEMEWRKEYTTNQIRINMTNHNSVSGEGDLDGLVISLRDKLVEELDYLPNGVYA